MSQWLSSCPLCGATKIEFLYKAEDPHYGIKGSFQISRCHACSLVFLNPMYSDEELTALYPSDYYSYHDEIKGSLWKQRAKKWLGYWQGTKEPRFEKPGTFLDLGCGNGAFVQHMGDLGWQAYGVEVNESAAKLAQSRNLQVYSGSLQQAQFSPETFDYIRASHSLEHITCPHETLDEVYRLLKPDGKLLIAIPNIRSLTARIFRQHWYHLCPPVHAFSYSVETIRRMLALHGFRVTRIVFNSSYPGLLGSAQVWLNRQKGTISSQGSLYEVRALRVLSGWLQHLCDLLHWGDMIELTAIKEPRESSVEPQHSETRAIA